MAEQLYGSALYWKKLGMDIFQNYICMKEYVHSQTISSNREGFHGKGVVDKFQKVLL